MGINDYIRRVIAEQIKYGNKKFVIYPAGRIGMKVKEELNDYFGIKELALVDNKRCEKEDGIISFSDLLDIDEWYVLLLATINEDAKNEITPELVKLKRPIIDVVGQPDQGVMGSVFFDFDWPRMNIESVSDKQLEKLFERTTKQWNELGNSEPYWSVITHDKYRSDSINSERIDEFYESGKQACHRIIQTLIRNGRIGSEEDAKELEMTEIGCGCGRVTKSISEKFKHVNAYDISSGNLRIARDAIDNSNVDFILVSSMDAYDELPQTDVVYSIIVLQHNVPPVSKYILIKLLDSLRRDGIGIFQIPSYLKDYSFSYADVVECKEQMDMHVLPQQDIFEAIRLAGCDVMECQMDQATGVASGFISSTYVVKKH